MLGMSTAITSPDSAKAVKVEQGEIVIQMRSGGTISFNLSVNLRLAKATPKQLSNLEISPFGLHWPDLDEDPSNRGMLAGAFGQSA
jgi:hypothetical protein